MEIGLHYPSNLKTACSPLDLELTRGMRFNILLLVPLIIASLQAASVDDLTFTLIDEGTAYDVTDCDNGASGPLRIPATYNGLPVKSIGSSAFIFCDNLTSVTIPDSVTSIGASAFRDCSSLTSINIPDGVPNLSPWVFWGCSSLTNVTIPDSVTSIGDKAFEDCSSLTSVTIPDSVISIGDYAFSECSSLGNLTLGSNVASIGDQGFYRTGIASLTIPKSMVFMGEEAFRECGRLISVTSEALIAPAINSSFGSGTFRDIGATRITVPAGSSGYGSFYGGMSVDIISNGDPAWEPQGWVYFSWPYAYSSNEGRWHYFDVSSTQWVVDLVTGIWETLGSSGD